MSKARRSPARVAEAAADTAVSASEASRPVAPSWLLLALLGFALAAPSASASPTAASLSGGALAAVASTAHALAPATQERAAVAPATPLLGALAASTPADRVIEGKLGRGETLIKALAAQGVASTTIALIQRHMKPHYDFRRARSGHAYRVALEPTGNLRSFHYRVSKTEHYWLESEHGRWRAWREEAEVRREKRKITGVVGASLHDAIADLGVTENERLAQDFAGIFAWDVDFSRGVQPGDRFSILYERTYAAQGNGHERDLGAGRILAAQYRGAGQELAAVYFETEPGHGDYFRPDGTSVQGRFLAAPLNYSRITSSFSLARFHPILRRTRPHFGIDYAAPSGTPIWSVANGVVSYAGWTRGYGRLVRIKHANGYESYYAHLSRYASTLRVGQAVRQKQVVGFVGSSGLSTGPHVCFRITKDGQFVDPLRVRVGNGDRIPKRQMASFEAVRDHRLGALGPAPIVATDEAM